MPELHISPPFVCCRSHLTRYLTKHLTILEPHDPEIATLYGVEKCYLTDFEALEMQIVESGNDFLS